MWKIFVFENNIPIYKEEHFKLFPIFVGIYFLIMEHFKTIIVDDEKAATEWLSIQLNEIPQISLLAVENRAEKALESILKLKPDLLFLDIEMPVYSGFQLLHIINQEGLHPVVVFVTAYNKYAIKAIKHMAFDYIHKPIDLDELRECIYRLEKRNLKNQSINIPPLKLVESLTLRETEVFKLLIEGKTSKEIAEELFIGKATVDSHRKNLLLKTQARNTSELVVWGITSFFI